jgi:hypothetical protein
MKYTVMGLITNILPLLKLTLLDEKIRGQLVSLDQNR